MPITTVGTARVVDTGSVVISTSVRNAELTMPDGTILEISIPQSGLAQSRVTPTKNGSKLELSDVPNGRPYCWTGGAGATAVALFVQRTDVPAGSIFVLNYTVMA